MLASSREPRGGAGVPGRDESRPYGRWQGPRPNKKPQPCGIANPRRGRFHIGPDRGGAGLPGRDLRPKSRRCAAVGLRNAPAGAVNPAPTNKFYVLDQPGWPPPRVIATSVGDDACIVPGTSRRRGGSPGGMNPAPTDDGKAPGQTRNHNPAVLQTRVGDDACIVPGTSRRRRGPGRDESRPYEQNFMFWTNRDARNHPDDRRAGCPHPAGPHAAADTPVLKLPKCGGRKRPPYGAGRNMVAGRQSVATQGPAGGPWPSPTNHGKRPAKLDGRRPALLQPL